MLTAICQNCGRPKEPANYADNYCPSCTSRKNEAEQHFAHEHPGATLGQVLYAGRQALLEVAHHARINHTDPRAFSAVRGMIPVPPQTDRGNPTGA